MGGFEVSRKTLRKENRIVGAWGNIATLSVGGVLGVNARYWLGLWISRIAGAQFP